MVVLVICIVATAKNSGMIDHEVFCENIKIDENAFKAFAGKKNAIYHKFPKYSDTQKFVVITLKFELYGSTIE